MILMLISIECWTCGIGSKWPIIKLAKCRHCSELFCEKHISENGVCFVCEPKKPEEPEGEEEE